MKDGAAKSALGSGTFPLDSELPTSETSVPFPLRTFLLLGAPRAVTAKSQLDPGSPSKSRIMEPSKRCPALSFFWLRRINHPRQKSDHLVSGEKTFLEKFAAADPRN